MIYLYKYTINLTTGKLELKLNARGYFRTPLILFSQKVIENTPIKKTLENQNLHRTSENA